MPLPSLLDPHQTADELRSLADEAGLVARADELRALAESLSTQTDLERWSQLDLHAAFVNGPAAAHADSEQPGAARGPAGLRGALLRHGDAVELLLGALVFLPLLITWIGLASAAEAYLQLVKSDPQEASRPFLQLWLSGFGGKLPGFLHFYDVAVCAAVILTLLFGLALLHAWLRSAGDRSEATLQMEHEELQKKHDRLVARLASALTRAHLVLQAHRPDTANRFARELTDVAEKLRELIADTTKVATAALSATNAATAASLAAESAVARLTAGIEAVERAQRDGAAAVTTSQREVADAVTTSQRETADAVTSSQERIAATMQGSQQKVADAVTTSQAGVANAVSESQQKVTSALTTSQAGVANAVSESQQKVTSALTTSQAGVANAVSESQQKVTSALTTAQRETADAVTSSQERVAAAVKGNAFALTGIGDGLNGARDAVVDASQSLDTFARANADTVEELRRAVNTATAALDEVRQSAEHWDAAAAHWEDAAGSVDRTARSLAEVVNAGRPDGAR